MMRLAVQFESVQPSNHEYERTTRVHTHFLSTFLFPFERMKKPVCHAIRVGIALWIKIRVVSAIRGIAS